MNIVILGSTGLVGKSVLDLAVNDPRIKKIYLLTRNHVQDKSNEKIEYLFHKDLFIDREFLKNHHINQIDAVLCALGTTIKKAGSKDSFSKIDRDLVLHLAKVFKSIGAFHFSVVSALGADPKSSIFYNQVKGEMEVGLKEIGFTSLTILRPSLLLGNRAEFRPSEKIMIQLSPVFNKFLIGNLKKYRGIEASLVAHYLHSSMFRSSHGIQIVENDQMLNLISF